MVGDLHPGHSEGPPARSWPRSHFPLPVFRPGPWLAIAVVVSASVAVAALAVALIRPGASHSSATTTAAPTHTPAESAAAQQQLCGAYKLAAQAAQVETAGSDKALARIATANGAILLEMGAANPALNAEHRDVARAPAMAWGTLTAEGSCGPATGAALDDAIAKDAAMKKVCGGG